MTLIELRYLMVLHQKQHTACATNNSCFLGLVTGDIVLIARTTHSRHDALKLLAQTVKNSSLL